MRQDAKPISLKSISTAARQTLRKLRRIHTLSVSIARRQGRLSQINKPDYAKAEAKVIRMCRRQRRKFAPIVDAANAAGFTPYAVRG